MDRTFGNAILYVFYRILTIINNSVWFYFAPFVFNQIAFFHIIAQKGAILEAAKNAGGEGGGEAGLLI